MRDNDLNSKNKDVGSIFDEVYKRSRDIKQELPAPLGKSQKIALVVLAFFAIFVFSFWFYQFKKSISQPFAYKGGENNNASLHQQDSEEFLKSKDTDGDGLSDWEELYFYKTSPYLEDSDSDGILDKQEVDNNEDPNCPLGRDCYASDSLSAGNSAGQNQQGTSTLNSFLKQLPKDQKSSQGGAGNLSEEQANALISGNIDAQTLRQILLRYGMDKKYLDNISDEQLLKDFHEAMSGQ